MIKKWLRYGISNFLHIFTPPSITPLLLAVTPIILLPETCRFPVFQNYMVLSGGTSISKFSTGLVLTINNRVPLKSSK